ncbi:MAG TPA: cellulose binding domain-containing protein [Actinophytocola sp.]|uniref:cellulose binding domain-containing protein n=1 Tax=Actinophytocola sp. TaxID=1872138 RepID=UPI002DDD5CAA|nr:cellulose binding domain-containing protein [Actinophytocola sp.]HEV2779303.1 cellulose binding domain-containing protein [Actinophytocola sp.]
MRRTPARRLLVGVLTLVLGLAGVLLAPTASAAGETATFTKVQDWGTGWEGRYTIRNGGTVTITSWRVEFDLPAGTSIGTHWDAVRGGSGNHYIFSNAGWNGTVAPGASVSFGFNASGPGAPANCTVNGQACGGGGTQPPGVPGNPSVTGVTASSISLAWGASSGTVSGYRVYEGNTAVATSSTTSATVTGLAPSSTHTYTVAAFNSAGESPRSAGVTGTTSGGTGAPGTPGNLRVTGATDTSISLAWNASSGTVSGYRVYEGTTVRATVTGTSATIGGLASCSTHGYTVAAFNGTGESGRAGPVSGTTTGCPIGPLPRHFLTGYWHNFTNPAVELRLRDVPAEYDVVAVAFAEATATPGAVTFAVDPGLSTALGGYTNADFMADVQTLHARGKKVILSVGGEAGRVSVGDGAAATNFANSMRSLIAQFGFDGVDIDLENGLNPTFMGQALRSLRNQVGANLIITMAPQTIDMQSTGGSYFQLALNIRDILTVVHTQYYNSGSMLGCDQAQAYTQGTVNFMTALACIQLENGLRPDQVALGLPAGPGAAGGGIVAPSLVNDALNCLARGANCGSFRPPRTYPGIRGAMTWSINWDVSNGNNFARTVRPFLNTLP